MGRRGAKRAKRLEAEKEEEQRTIRSGMKRRSDENGATEEPVEVVVLLAPLPEESGDHLRHRDG
jgi:hypothetical protein